MANVILCRNCCVNQYFAPLFFVVFVLMAQFVSSPHNQHKVICLLGVGQRGRRRSDETPGGEPQTGKNWANCESWISIVIAVRMTFSFAWSACFLQSERLQPISANERIEWISRSSLRISSSCNASNCARWPPTSGWPRCSEGTRRGSSGEQRRS